MSEDATWWDDINSYIKSVFPKDKYEKLVFFPPEYPSEPVNIRLFYKYVNILLQIISKMQYSSRYGYKRLVTELRRPFRYLSRGTIASAFNIIRPYTSKEYFEAEYFDGYVVNIGSEGYKLMSNLIETIQKFLNSLSSSLNDEVPCCCLKDLIMALKPISNLNQEGIKNILKTLAKIVFELKFSQKMTLAELRKLLKYEVFTDDVLSYLYNPKNRSKNIKNINKLMKEFPDLYTTFLNRNIENGLTEDMDKNVIEKIILDNIEKMPVLNLIKNKFEESSSDSSDTSDIYTSARAILKKGELQSYMKEYFLAISDGEIN